MVLDDFDDLLNDAPTKPAPRASRFQPKSAKLKPKPEPQPELPQTKHEEIPPTIDIKPDVITEPIIIEPKPDESMVDTEFVAEDSNAEPMDEDTEDEIVRTIDVYFTPPPLDSSADLYVMQYPLRPSWRPYELDERCKEVRIQPKTGKVEVELSLDTDSNYDHEVADSLRIEKQILSSWRPPLTTSYAVGILKGNKLHLNPVHAVVQLRPSMEHLTFGRSKKSNAAQNVESTSKKQGKMVESTPGPVTDSEQSWISLDYHGKINGESSLSTRYLKKMTSEVHSDIQFSMSPYEYINSLCPGSSTENDGNRRQLKRSLLALPLKERFERWFTEGPQVNRFTTLKHLAPDHSDEDVLNTLQIYACLIQGLWISRTSLLKLKRADAIARDYLLLLLKNNDVINRKQLDEYNLFREAEPYLKEFAVYRPSTSDWKLKEPRDVSFLNSYPHIVEEQKKKLEDMHNLVVKVLQKAKSAAAKKIPVSSGGVTKNPVNADQAAKLPVNGSRPVTIPDLPKSLETLLRKHNVCSMQLICEGLKEQGILKADEAPPLPELHSVMDQIAIKIRDVYVLKSLGDPSLDPLRRVVIDLLGAKEPNAKLKKADILEAAKISRLKEISNGEYTKVMTQLCSSVKGGGWVLRSGDGNSKLNSLDIPDASNS